MASIYPSIVISDIWQDESIENKDNGGYTWLAYFPKEQFSDKKSGTKQLETKYARSY